MIPLIPVFLITFFIACMSGKSFHLYPMLFLGQMPVEGPGNYFIALILTSIITLPVLWWISKKNMGLMLAGSFMTSLSFEIFFPKEYSAPFYVFKFLFAFAIGIFLADCIISKKMPLKLVIGICTSTILVIYLAISGRELFNPYLTYFNVLTFLFTAGLILSIIQFNISWKPINFLGKSSYHIFLTQMVFFILFNLGIIINLLMISIVGILFYYSEQKTESLILLSFENGIKEMKK